MGKIISFPFLKFNLQMIREYKATFAMLKERGQDPIGSGKLELNFRFVGPSGTGIMGLVLLKKKLQKNIKRVFWQLCRSKREKQKIEK